MYCVVFCIMLSLSLCRRHHLLFHIWIHLCMCQLISALAWMAVWRVHWFGWRANISTMCGEKYHTFLSTFVVAVAAIVIVPTWKSHRTPHTDTHSGATSKDTWHISCLRLRLRWCFTRNCVECLTPLEVADKKWPCHCRCLPLHFDPHTRHYIEFFVARRELPTQDTSRRFLLNILSSIYDSRRSDTADPSNHIYIFGHGRWPTGAAE